MAAKYPHSVFAQLPCYIEPIDRGEKFEDPLGERLKAAGAGEVTGGGSQLGDDFVITGIGIDIDLANLDEAVKLTTKTLEDCGAPKGSTLTFEEAGEEQKIAFGCTEGVALVLDASLPAELWDKHAQEVLPSLEAIIQQENLGAIFGTKTFEDRTDIYIYGSSAESIIKGISKWQSEFPLGKNSKVRKIGADNPT